MSQAQTITIGKIEYVILPKPEYLRLQNLAGVPAGSVDAVEDARASIGATLKAAREHAGLTQAELARALRRSQPTISGAASGTISVSDRNVKAVLKACDLPEDGSGPTKKRARRKRLRPGQCPERARATPWHSERIAVIGAAQRR